MCYKYTYIYIFIYLYIYILPGKKIKEEKTTNEKNKSRQFFLLYIRHLVI